MHRKGYSEQQKKIYKQAYSSTEGMTIGIPSTTM